MFIKMKKFNCNKCGKKILMSVAKISHKILDWRDILQLFMKKRLNCDQCGKIFARGCNLKVHIQILHEKDFEFIVMTVAKMSPKPYIW